MNDRRKSIFDSIEYIEGRYFEHDDDQGILGIANLEKVMREKAEGRPRVLDIGLLNGLNADMEDIVNDSSIAKNSQLKKHAREIVSAIAYCRDFSEKEPIGLMFEFERESFQKSSKDKKPLFKQKFDYQPHIDNVIESCEGGNMEFIAFDDTNLIIKRYICKKQGELLDEYSLPIHVENHIAQKGYSDNDEVILLCQYTDLEDRTRSGLGTDYFLLDGEGVGSTREIISEADANCVGDFLKYIDSRAVNLAVPVLNKNSKKPRL